MTSHPIHPLGTRARILLSSVFGPYAQDDEYGSRKNNPMELYHNQVTRMQGAFSLRMFHRSFGLMMIQANLDTPCTLLDFPTQERFIQEITTQSYDIVGISAILPNIGKVRRMCELVRQYHPQATVVVGGHVTNKEDIDRIVDADYIVRGEGVQWFRKFLGQDDKQPVRPPLAYSGFGGSIMGVPIPEGPRHTAAILIPSVGCPLGCNFCSTSALFGGKGKFINFYETGDELFSIMEQIEKTLKVHSFFVLDENFLLHRKRALRLLELMKESGKSWSLYVFSSARVLRSYSIKQLVGLGISWVWMGLEGENSQYEKLGHVDTRALVKFLQSHGIRVLGSSILGLENHTPENIDGVIDYAVSHSTDFHQFMLYTPLPGTPLYAQHRHEGTLLPETEFSPADMHGQYRFNYRHPHIRNGQEEVFLLQAFIQDFKVNGPSLARLIRTFLTGWKRYKNHPEQRIRKRFAREVSPLRTSYAGAVWTMRKEFGDNKAMTEEMDSLLKLLYQEFGWLTRLIAPLVGCFAYFMLKREEARLAKGCTREPHCFYEKNPAALAREKAGYEARPRQKELESTVPLINKAQPLHS
jgi:radical SAM superfamily enzyme YgiQ (UPF0313 family)